LISSKLSAEQKAVQKVARGFAAVAKTFCSDMAMRVTTDVVQVFGGYGYMRDYPVEKHVRDAIINQIVDGTNQIQRTVTARALLGR